MHICVTRPQWAWWVKFVILILLTHWGRVTHICVGNLTIIGSDNGLSPGQRQAIIWTNAGILLIRTLGTNFSEILGEIHSFSFSEMHLKMSSAKWRLFGLGLNVLMLSEQDYASLLGLMFTIDRDYPKQRQKHCFILTIIPWARAKMEETPSQITVVTFLFSTNPSNYKVSSINSLYNQTSTVRHTLVGNKIVDHSDVVGASAVSTAPIASSFST